MDQGTEIKITIRDMILLLEKTKTGIIRNVIWRMGSIKSGDGFFSKTLLYYLICY